MRNAQPVKTGGLGSDELRATAVRLGDVRSSVSGEEGGTPTVAAKHTTEHPPCHSELRRSRVYRWRLRS